MAQHAIALNPDNPSAWAYKNGSLRELARLADRLGQGQQRDEYIRQAAAEARAAELEGKHRDKVDSVRSC